jgi:hypothetical protein
MLSKGALAVAVSAIVVEAIDNGLARTPQMGWVSFPLLTTNRKKSSSKMNQ